VNSDSVLVTKGLLQDQTKALVLPAKLFVKSFFVQAVQIFINKLKRQTDVADPKPPLAIRMPRIKEPDDCGPVNGNAERSGDPLNLVLRFSTAK
jgi:hypothetical protein